MTSGWLAGREGGVSVELYKEASVRKRLKIVYDITHRPMTEFINLNKSK